jgi:hypothetical protein
MSGKVVSKDGKGQGGTAVEHLSELMQILHRYKGPQDNAAWQEALEKLRKLAASCNDRVWPRDPLSPRKGKRKVEQQSDTRVGVTEKFAQLLADAASIASDLDIRQCESAYAQAFKRMCCQPHLPEGQDGCIKASWPIFGRQCWQVSLEEGEHVGFGYTSGAVPTCRL